MVQKNRETVITVRCDDSLRNSAQLSAAEAGQSLVEWIRRAMKEKLERESSPYSIAAQERRVQELENQMMLVQMQISEMKQPYITQTAGRDAKIRMDGKQ